MSDEDAQVWYGFCTYWTDDWGQLSRVEVKGSPSGIEGRAVGVLDGGIPCCPDCGSVGYQMDKTDWDEGVEKLEASEPGYAKFLAGVKERCHGKGISLGNLWEEQKR